MLWRLQRLMRDFRRLQQDPPQGVDGSPNPDNIMLWNAVIFGPEDTPWDGGKSLAKHLSLPHSHACCLCATVDPSVQNCKNVLGAMLQEPSS